MFGNFFSGHVFWSQPCPCSQPVPGVAFARAATRCSTSLSDVAPVRSTTLSADARLERCACASMMPGMTACPFASTTFVSLPLSLSAAALVPTNVIRPLATANASALGAFSSTVWTFALVTIRSGVCAASETAAGAQIAHAATVAATARRRTATMIEWLGGGTGRDRAKI